MRPKQPEAPSITRQAMRPSITRQAIAKQSGERGWEGDDLLRSSLKVILDPEHALLKLAQLIDWDRFDDAFGRFYHERKGRPGLRTRPPLGDAMHQP